MTSVTQLPVTSPDAKQSEATRFLCSDIFLGHDDDIRRKFYAYVINRYHSIADNHGLNIRLLARVLDFHYQKQLRYLAWHGPLGVLYFLILGSWFWWAANQIEFGVRSRAANPDTQN